MAQQKTRKDEVGFWISVVLFTVLIPALFASSAYLAHSAPYVLNGTDTADTAAE